MGSVDDDASVFLDARRLGELPTAAEVSPVACDACRRAPAAVYCCACSTECQALCRACDAATHLAGRACARHVRFALLGKLVAAPAPPALALAAAQPNSPAALVRSDSWLSSDTAAGDPLKGAFASDDELLPSVVGGELRAAHHLQHEHLMSQHARLAVPDGHDGLGAEGGDGASGSDGDSATVDESAAVTVDQHEQRHWQQGGDVGVMGVAAVQRDTVAALKMSEDLFSLGGFGCLDALEDDDDDVFVAAASAVAGLNACPAPSVAQPLPPVALATLTDGSQQPRRVVRPLPLTKVKARVRKALASATVRPDWSSEASGSDHSSDGFVASGWASGKRSPTSHLDSGPRPVRPRKDRGPGGGKGTGGRCELSVPIAVASAADRAAQAHAEIAARPPGAPPQRRCVHCGATKTPQWRAGPVGPKTLCNACGVRFKHGRLQPAVNFPLPPKSLLTGRAP